jgi:hypothetical protein
MSNVDAITAFRDEVNQNSDLQRLFVAAYQAGPEAVVALAASRGFAFGLAEYEAALASISEATMTPFERSLAEVTPEGDELSAYELELVSAGGSPSCILAGGNSRSDVDAS